MASLLDNTLSKRECRICFGKNNENNLVNSPCPGMKKQVISTRDRLLWYSKSYNNPVYSHKWWWCRQFAGETQ